MTPGPASPASAPGRRARLSAALVAAGTTGVVALWIRGLPARKSIASIDLYFLFHPAHERLGRALASGHLPVWNPDLGLGINELADSQFGFLYPPNLLFAALPTAVASEILTWLHVGLAGLGVVLLCRRAGLALSSAAIGAAALCASAALHYLALWTTMLATFAWCPMAFFAARRLADRPGAGPALALAAVLALQILAGYLQFALYTIGLLPLFLWPACARAPGAVARVLQWTVAAVLLAVCLAAVGLFPALAAVEGSWRDPRYLPKWFYELLTVDLTTYAGGFARAGLGDHLSPYVGVLVPLLAMGALGARHIARGLRLPALALTALAVVLSLGSRTPLFPLLWRLPFANALTNPHKWMYFAVLGVALLAAVGAEGVRRGQPPAARAGWAVGALAALLAIPFAWPTRVAGGGLLLALTLPRRSVWLARALPIVVLATILPGYTDRPQRPSDDVEIFTRYRDAYRYLARRQGDGRLFVLAPMLSYSPRQGEMEGVAQITTNGTFLSARLERYLTTTRTAARERNHEKAVGLLRSIGARFVLTAVDDLRWLGTFGFARAFVGESGQIWEDPAALPRAYLAERIEIVPDDQVLDRLGVRGVSGGRRVILEASEGRLSRVHPGGAPHGTVDLLHADAREVRIATASSDPGLLVLLDSWSPDWRATVDGQSVPIRHANLVARAIEVPAGEHLVVFRFVPTALHAGAATSALAAAIVLLGYVGARRRGSGPPGHSRA